MVISKVNSLQTISSGGTALYPVTYYLCTVRVLVKFGGCCLDLAACMQMQGMDVVVVFVWSEVEAGLAGQPEPVNGRRGPRCSCTAAPVPPYCLQVQQMDARRGDDWSTVKGARGRRGSPSPRHGRTSLPPHLLPGPRGDKQPACRCGGACVRSDEASVHHKGQAKPSPIVTRTAEVRQSQHTRLAHIAHCTTTGFN